MPQLAVAVVRAPHEEQAAESLEHCRLCCSTDLLLPLPSRITSIAVFCDRDTEVSSESMSENR